VYFHEFVYTVHIMTAKFSGFSRLELSKFEGIISASGVKIIVSEVSPVHFVDNKLDDLFGLSVKRNTGGLGIAQSTVEGKGHRL